MKKYMIIAILLFAGATSQAQFSKATLQASGLTCSMCSKAVKEALEKVPFIEKVMVNIKTQEYSLTFKASEPLDFDQLSAAVEDAGFSIASLKVVGDATNIKAIKNEHVKVGDKYFHFLNGGGKTLDAATIFTIVDKAFVTEKEFKKYSNSMAMPCVTSGKSESCCKGDNVPENARVYHVII